MKSNRCFGFIRGKCLSQEQTVVLGSGQGQNHHKASPGLQNSKFSLKHIK